MLKRTFLAIVILACLAPAVFFAARWQRSEAEVREQRAWSAFLMDSLGASTTFPPPPEGPEGRDSVYWQWVATTARLQSRRWQQAVRHWVENRATLLDPVDVELLRREGLIDPARQLRDSLLAHPELIPFEGVSGGTMGFMPDEGIVLLEPPYVFAQFEDGHIGGSMLLSYAVLSAPQTEIVWTRLWATRD